MTRIMPTYDGVQKKYAGEGVQTGGEVEQDGLPEILDIKWVEETTG